MPKEPKGEKLKHGSHRSQKRRQEKGRDAAKIHTVQQARQGEKRCFRQAWVVWGFGSLPLLLSSKALEAFFSQPCQRSFSKKKQYSYRV